MTKLRELRNGRKSVAEAPVAEAPAQTEAPVAEAPVVAEAPFDAAFRQGNLAECARINAIELSGAEVRAAVKFGQLFHAICDRVEKLGLNPERAAARLADEVYVNLIMPIIGVIDYRVDATPEKRASALAARFKGEWSRAYALASAVPNADGLTSSQVRHLTLAKFYDVDAIGRVKLSDHWAEWFAKTIPSLIGVSSDETRATIDAEIARRDSESKVSQLKAEREKIASDAAAAANPAMQARLAEIDSQVQSLIGAPAGAPNGDQESPKRKGGLAGALERAATEADVARRLGALTWTAGAAEALVAGMASNPANARVLALLAENLLKNAKAA